MTGKVKALGTDCCPVKAFGRFMVLRGGAKDNLFCFQDGKPVISSWYTKVFRALIAKAGLSSMVKPHSASIWAATRAAASGVHRTN